LADAPVPCIVDLVRWGHGLAIMASDAGRTSLASLLRQGPVEIGEFLRYASLATEAVEQVYSRGVLHKERARRDEAAT
jgi:hypothetical protein